MSAVVIFLVVAKSHWNNSFRIVAFDGHKLFDLDVSNDHMDIIKPGNAYQCQLVNLSTWDPAIVVAQPVAVQGAPIQLEMLLYGMFAALGNIASKSFTNIYPNVGNGAYLNVGIIPQPPRAFLVQGNLIKKQKMNDGRTRCCIMTDVGEINIRYTGYSSEIYNRLPVEYEPNLVCRQYTLILVVGDPITGRWEGTRNYILVVAVY